MIDGIIDAFAVVFPVTVDDSVLSPTGSNVPENDYAQWSSLTTYAKGHRAIILADHDIYQSVQDANTNHPPAADDGTWWTLVSKTNRYKMFDGSNSSATVNAESIEDQFHPGTVITTLAALGMTGISFQAIMTDPVEGVVYDSGVILLIGIIPEANWWSYFFSQTTQVHDVILDDLPSYYDAELSIDIQNPGADAKCETLLFGQETMIGYGVELGARLGIQDYSRRERNQFGDLVLIERNYSRKASFEMYLDWAEVDQAMRLFAALRAKPALYIGYAPLTATAVFGIYKDFEITIPYPTRAFCTIDLEGLT